MDRVRNIYSDQDERRSEQQQRERDPVAARIQAPRRGSVARLLACRADRGDRIAQDRHECQRQKKDRDPPDEPWLPPAAAERPAERFRYAGQVLSRTGAREAGTAPPWTPRTRASSGE